MDQRNIEIGEIVWTVIHRNGMSQKEIASKLSISPPSLCQMLKGTAALPFERFCQIISIVKFKPEELNRAFRIYSQKLGIPDDALALFDGGWIQKRLRALLAMPSYAITGMRKKELEVINYWTQGMPHDLPEPEDETEWSEEQKMLWEYCSRLSPDKAPKALSILKMMFEE